MRNLILLIILILLEVYFIPLFNFRENYKILSRTTIHFLNIVSSILTTKETLKDRKFIQVIVIAVNYLFGKFLISQFYDTGCKYFDSSHSLVVIFITIIPFIFFTNEEDIRELEDDNSNFKIFCHNGIKNIISNNQLFYFYKHFHLKHGNIIEYNFNKQLVIHFIVDFFANSFSCVINNLLAMYFNKKNNNNKKYFMNIFKRFMMIGMSNFAFYSIYSFQMARKIFDFVIWDIPSPHNLVLYNMLPKDLDQRFRMFLYIFNWFIS